jgi:hypothetical protein
LAWRVLASPQRERAESKGSTRARRDEEFRQKIRRVWNEHQQATDRGAWRQLRREGVRVARSVGHVMRAMGLRGAVRGRAWKITTQADPAAALCVADFTYVAM